MPLLGAAAVAMWWDVSGAQRREFEDWHTHEHFPERLGIPGFLRGSRWPAADGGEGWFVMYELESWETLTSPHYLARLNQPTPWSTRMMPHHRNMVRSQCRVALSHGLGVAQAMLTVRLSPLEGRAQELMGYLAPVLPRVVGLPGVTGAHLLQTQTPVLAGPTTEQKIRGGDALADWILLVSGYEAAAVQALRTAELGAQTLAANGADRGQMESLHRLSHAVTQRDVATLG